MEAQEKASEAKSTGKKQLSREQLLQYVKKLRAENKTLQARVKQLEDVKDAADDGAEDGAAGDGAGLAKALQESQEALDAERERSEALARQAESLQQENARLNRATEELGEKASALGESIEALSSERDAAVAAKEALEESLSVATREKDSLQTQVKTSLASVQALETKCQEQGQAIHELQMRLAQDEAEGEERSESDRQAAAAHSQELEERCRQQAEEISKLQEKLSAAAETADAAQRNSVRELEDVKANLSATQQNLSATQQSLQEVAETLSHTTSELDEMKSAAVEAERRASDSEAHAAALQEKFLAMKQDAKALQEMLAVPAAAAASASGENGSNQAGQAELLEKDKALADALKQVEVANAKIADLEEHARATTLRDKSEEAPNASVAGEGEAEEEEEEEEELRQVVLALQEKQRGAERDLDALSAQSEEYKRALNEREQALAEASVRAEAAAKEVLELKDALKEMEEQLRSRGAEEAPADGDRVEATSEHLESLQRQVTELQASENLWKERAEKYNKGYKKLRASRDKVEKQLRDDLKARTAELQQARDRAEALEASQQSQTEGASAALQARDASLSSLTAQVKSLTAQVTSLTAQATSLTEETDRVRNEASQEKATLQAELEKVAQEKEQVTSQVEQERKRLSEQVEALEATCAEKQGQIDEMQQQLKRVQKDAGTEKRFQQGALGKVQERLEKAAKNASDLEKKNQKLRSLLTRQRDSLKGKETDLAELRQALGWPSDISSLQILSRVSAGGGAAEEIYCLLEVTLPPTVEDSFFSSFPCYQAMGNRCRFWASEGAFQRRYAVEVANNTARLVSRVAPAEEGDAVADEMVREVDYPRLVQELIQDAAEEASKAAAERMQAREMEFQEVSSAHGQLQSEFDKYKQRARLALQRAAQDAQISMESKQAVEELAENLAAARTDLAECEKEKRASQEARDKAEGQIVALEEKLKVLVSQEKRKIALLEERNQDLSSQIAIRKDELDLQSEELARARAKCESLETAVDKLKRELANYTHDLDSERKRGLELREKLQQAHKTVVSPSGERQAENKPVASEQKAGERTRAADESPRAKPEAVEQPFNLGDLLEDDSDGRSGRAAAASAPQPERSPRAPVGESHAGLVVIEQLKKRAQQEQKRLRDALEVALKEAGDARADLEKHATQTQLLKEVVRELQEELARSKELSLSGQQAVENAEFLKNVVVGYLASTDPGEHRRILPVIASLLHLSSAEVRRFTMKGVAQPQRRTCKSK